MFLLYKELYTIVYSKALQLLQIPFGLLCKVANFWQLIGMIRTLNTWIVLNLINGCRKDLPNRCLLLHLKMHSKWRRKKLKPFTKRLISRIAVWSRLIALPMCRRIVLIYGGLFRKLTGRSVIYLND